MVLAEVVALGTIMLNLHFALAAGETLTTETMQRLIERADRTRFTRRSERLAARRGGSYERDLGPHGRGGRVAASQARLDPCGACWSR